MCLVAIAYRQIDGVPVFVAANREESYTRPATPPQLLPGNPPFVCGIDQQAGGTWLGVNARGVLVGITNRAKSQPPPKPRSRGLLCRDLLRCTSAREASEAGCREIGAGAYAGCNLFCIDRAGAYVVEGGDWLRVVPLPPGWHVLAAGDVNDFGDPRVIRAYDWLRTEPPSDLARALDVTQEICRTHNDDGPPLCLHFDGRGTVSSSLVALGDWPNRSVYLHSSGPPCVTPYGDYSDLLGNVLRG